MMLAMSTIDGLMVAGFVLAVQGVAFLIGMWITRKHPLSR